VVVMRLSVSRRRSKERAAKKDFEDALAAGRMKALRLARLGDDGKSIVVASVDAEFSDKGLQQVGVCSYTWGFGRVEWEDAETGMSWLVSDRAIEMCRAALKFFPRVWIDGLCMVQAWPDHVALCMEYIGKLYWHANVVTESVIKLKPEYTLRGWVSQEISFTKLMYDLRPLREWMENHKAEVEAAEKSIKKGPNSDGVFGREDFKGETFDSFQNAINETFLYLPLLIRASEGRANTKGVSKKVRELQQSIRQANLVFGGFSSDTLISILQSGLDVTGSFERDDSKQGLLNSAMQSFRSGWFLKNEDRPFACFSLPSYALGVDTNGLQTELDNLTPKERKFVTILGNPGRWSTGLGPVIDLNTLAWPHFSEPGPLQENGHEHFKDRSALDAFFAVLHNLQESALKKYTYVIGWRVLRGSKYACACLGLKSSDRFIRGLVAANFTVDEESKTADYLSAQLLVNTEFKYEFGPKAVSLLNASRTVYDKLENGEQNIAFPVHSRNVEMLEFPAASLSSPFQNKMHNAMHAVLFALGTAASFAYREEETERALWGGPSYEHTYL